MFGRDGHWHFGTRTPKGQTRFFADDAGDTGGAPAPAPATPAGDFASIAADVDASEFDIGTAPEPEPAKAADPEPEPTPAGEPAAKDDDEGDEGGDKPEPTDAEKMQTLLDGVNGEAMKLDPDAVPESLRPHLKNFQADYTRKTQALADKSKQSAEELAGDVVKDLNDKIAALEGKVIAPQQPAVAPQAQSAPLSLEDAVRQSVERDLGKMVEFNDFVKSDDPLVMQKYLSQQNEISARTAVARYAQQNEARFAEMNTSVDQQVAQRDAQHRRDAFFEANTDLTDYEPQLAGLVQSGMSIEDSAKFVRASINSENDRSAAMMLGAQIGEKRARQTDDNKEKFSTPHASTGGKGGPEVTPDMSFEEMGLKAAEKAGLLT